MEASQRGWYRRPASLAGLDNAGLTFLSLSSSLSRGECPGELCRMLHINTRRHFLADKQHTYTYSFFFLWNHVSADSSQKPNPGLFSLHRPYLIGNKCSSRGYLGFLETYHHSREKITHNSLSGWSWIHSVSARFYIMTSEVSATVAVFCPNGKRVVLLRDTEEHGWIWTQNLRKP